MKLAADEVRQARAVLQGACNGSTTVRSVFYTLPVSLDRGCGWWLRGAGVWVCPIHVCHAGVLVIREREREVGGARLRDEAVIEDDVTALSWL